MQQHNTGGLLANGMANMVGDALLEVPIWTRLQRPVPGVAQEVAKQAEKLRVASASVTAIVRTYNKVCSTLAGPVSMATTGPLTTPDDDLRICDVDGISER